MAPHRVVAVVLEGVRPLDLAAPAHFFGHLGGALYDLALAGVEPGMVRTSAGFDIAVEHGVRAIERADTIVVPGFEDPSARPPEPLIRAIRSAAERGARAMSVCTGAFVLAYAGLLDGRRATTHWDSAGRLASLFPEVEVDPNVLFVDEGDVLTSAGVAAGLDLCLHVVRRDHGAAVASSFARRTVIAPFRDGGQAQFIEMPTPPEVERTTDLAATRSWALERLAEPLSVEALAQHALVSPRTFARRFRAETGTTPHRWLLQQRILEARRLLESSGTSIEDLASLTGFGSAASLRVHFRRQMGTSPTAYRQTFAGNAATA
ncbi:MAG TPA: helix-turn-helix domain-containing protein [Thermoleophilaceae bacterium]|nr:helix-turn-helix domain-containing protein [Thermoleophilaceae bacterium]